MSTYMVYLELVMKLGCLLLLVRMIISNDSDRPPTVKDIAKIVVYSLGFLL